MSLKEEREEAQNILWNKRRLLGLFNYLSAEWYYVCKWGHPYLPQGRRRGRLSVINIKTT